MRARLLKIFMVILVLVPVGLTAYLANSLYHRKGVPEALENLTKQLFQSKEDERKAENRAQALERKTEELQTAYDALVADLRGEVDSRQIRVRQFKEKLEINFVDKILFASGSADITPKGRDILTRVGAVLGKVKDKSIYVVGHTDNMPIHSSMYPSNWELSAARASSVIRYLSEAGELSPERFTAMGRAFYQPVASNTTADGRQENRRVDIIVADVPLLAGETGSEAMRGTVSGAEKAAGAAGSEERGAGEPLRQTAPGPQSEGGAAASAPAEPVKAVPATPAPAEKEAPAAAAPDNAGQAPTVGSPAENAPATPPASEPAKPETKSVPASVDQPGSASSGTGTETPPPGGAPDLPPPLPAAPAGNSGS